MALAATLRCGLWTWRDGLARVFSVLAQREEIVYWTARGGDKPSVFQPRAIRGRGLRMALDKARHAYTTHGVKGAEAAVGPRPSARH